MVIGSVEASPLSLGGPRPAGQPILSLLTSISRALDFPGRLGQLPNLISTRSSMIHLLPICISSEICLRTTNLRRDLGVAQCTSRIVS